MTSFRGRMSASLRSRLHQSTLRKLDSTSSLNVDFLSNDYLGISTLSLPPSPSLPHGSTGSRLLSGNTPSHSSLESYVSLLYTSHLHSVLLFNSGYTANLGVFGVLPRANDAVVMDEESHSSMFQGFKLSRCFEGGGRVSTFRHNDAEDLGEAVRRSGEGKSHVILGLESYYSMSGELASLPSLVSSAVSAGREVGCEVGVVVDEAHGTGTFNGTSLLKEAMGEMGELRGNVLAGVLTFGKSVGCHGGAVVDYNAGEGGSEVKEYLINYARTVIYTTSLPPGECERVRGCLEYLNGRGGEERREMLRRNVEYFKEVMGGGDFRDGVEVKGDADGPIQAIMTPGAELCVRMAEWIREGGFEVRAIRKPTVKEGGERLRVVVHSYNTKEEIDGLKRRVEGFWDR